MTHLRLLLTAITLMIVWGSPALSQERGVIRGTIRDAGTKEGLPLVNVKIKGTYYGAAADLDGNYVIANMAPGSYTLEFTILGYTTVQRTDVKVIAGQETIVNQDLAETVLSLGQEVVVVGEKPLFNLDETSSRRSVTAEDLRATPVVDVKDVVTQQVGVVQTDNEVHIRGGRSHENAYLLDGVSVQDPLAGTGFGLQLSADVVEEIEVITGGYNAEYGQATSGVVNVSLKEGGERYRGGLVYKTDKPGASNGFLNSFNSESYEFTLSGPEPISGLLFPLISKDLGSVTFFTSLVGAFSDGYTNKAARQLISSTFHGSRFAPKQENNWLLLGKLTWRPSSLFRVNFSYNHSVAINQNSQSLQTNLEYVEPSPGYQYEYGNILDEANTYTHDNQFFSVGITHTLSNSLFYELKLTHYFVSLRADANGKHYSEYREPKDIVTFPVEYYNLDRDTVGIIPGDGLWDYGNGFTWHDHFVTENTIKFDLTKHFSEYNKFKAGLETTFQDMQNVDIYQPWVGVLGLNNDIYKVSPRFGALYAQDNITVSGMILNVGLRFDYWFPGKYVDDAVNNPDVTTIPDKIREDYRRKTFSMFGLRGKGRISPRVGISHPISENQMLFFSYGHFSKRPKPQFIYAKLDPATAQSTFQKFGNPDLDPETTVAYELGLQTQFSSDDVLTVTAYYKDIFDYVSTRQARITSSRLSTGNFVTYVNQDYARSRGIEFEYRKRIGRWFRGTASGSYSITTGKSSSPDQGLLVARGDEDETIKENYVTWDRPLQFNLTTTFNVLKDQPLFGFGQGILDDYSVYVRAFFQSGKRYTPYIQDGFLSTNGRPNYILDRNDRLAGIGEDWFWIDLNIEKNFTLLGLDWLLSINIRNVLDRKNAAIINPVTGRAYELGEPTPTSWNDPVYPDLQAPVSPYPFNPARYLAPRNVLVGLGVRF